MPNKTRDDSFASYVLNFTSTLNGFLNGETIAREIDVFGMLFDQEVYICGVIDEIRWNADLNEITLLEFKTRKTPTMPYRRQFESNKMQVMLYKALFDHMVSGNFDKSAFAKHLQLNLNAELHPSLCQRIAFLLPGVTVHTLDGLLDVMMEKTQRFPRVAKMEMEYQYQMDKQIIGKVSVNYEEAWLRNTFLSYASLWLGQRRAQGVDVEDAWKCSQCDFAPVCECHKRQQADSSALHFKVNVLLFKVNAFWHFKVIALCTSKLTHRSIVCFEVEANLIVRNLPR